VSRRFYRTPYDFGREQDRGDYPGGIMDRMREFDEYPGEGEGEGATIRQEFGQDYQKLNG
jgi:hypothetical protein